MQISQQENGDFILSEVESPMLEMLHSIPDSALPQDDPVAERRLYQSPSEATELNDEWREYVHPELKEWFTSATDQVRSDLETLPLSSDEPLTITIPAGHVELWLNALNQARLALAARYAVSEEDMERATDSELTTPREVALFQIHFYGFLQECLIQGIE